MRRPVRHKARLNFLGSPVRPALTRPMCLKSRMPARKFTEKQLNAKWEQATQEGFELGLDVGHLEARLKVVESYLHGEPLDLLTRDQLSAIALGLSTMAAAVTEKMLNIPVEPYLQVPGKVYLGDDGDLDIPLDDEDESS